MHIIFGVNGLLKKMKQFLPLSFLTPRMIIGKNLGQPTLNFLIYQCLVISPLLEVRREIKVTIKVFNQGIEMIELLPLTSTLLISKDKTRNLKNNKILARSNAITVRKQVTMPVSIMTISQKPSFNLDNFFVKNYGQYES